METKNSFLIKKCAGKVMSAILCAAPGLFAAAAFAEGGGHGGANHHAPSFNDIIPYWINFAMFVALLGYVLKKPVSKAWAARIENINVSVNKGKIEREAAEKALQEAKQRELSLAKDIEKLAAQIKKEGETEAAELINDAKIRADRARGQGRDMVASETKAYEVSLKKALAEEVVTRATKKIMDEMNAEKDSKLRSAAIKNIQSLVH